VRQKHLFSLAKLARTFQRKTAGTNSHKGFFPPLISQPATKSNKRLFAGAIVID